MKKFLLILLNILNSFFVLVRFIRVSILFGAIFALLNTNLLFADELVKAKLDSVEILIRDSAFSKAKIIIKDINNKELAPQDQVKYFFFQGMLEFEEKNYLKALDHYNNAKKKITFLKPDSQTEIKNAIDTFIAQSHYALKNYESAISALNRQKNRTEKSYLILSGSYWELGKKDQAFNVLNSSLKTYPNSSALIKQQAIYFAELGLLHELYLQAESLLNLSNTDKPYYMFLVSLIKQKKEPELALKLVEKYIAKYSFDAEALSELAYLYFSQGKTLAAKDLYMRAAQLDSKYAYHAAEILIRSNDLILAKYYNTLILDQKKKTKQRFAIDLKMMNYHDAYFLKDELNRLGLLEDDSILYALAYCAIKIGKTDYSSKLLSRIKSPEMFKKALKLKNWTEECLSEGSWKCLI